MRHRPPLPHLLCGLLALLLTPPATAAQPPSAAALHAFDNAAAQIEQRLAQQRPGSLPGPPRIERIPEPSPPGALLHHWRATAFAPGARAADFNRILRDFAAYPRRFAPEVLSAHAEPLAPNRYQATLRVRQKHVLTVVLDSTYDVTFGSLEPTHAGWSTSRSTSVEELGADSHPVATAHGFLWRLNSYWSWQERDGGLALSLECLSLSRDLPAGLGWALRPYVESVPRESLEFTLRSALSALQSQAPQPQSGASR